MTSGPNGAGWQRPCCDDEGTAEGTTVYIDDHLLTPLQRAARDHPDDAVAAFRGVDRFIDVSAAAFWAQVKRIAAGLVASGIDSGDRVALMGKTSLQWLLVDTAIVAAGAVTVPVYETSSPSQVEWILRDSEAVMFMVATSDLAAMTRSVTDAVSTCTDVVVIDDSGLAALEKAGSSTPASVLEARIAAIDPSDPATIIYTSGTTGRPKGCVLSHRNLRANVHQISDALKGTVSSTDTCLLFLPLAHVLTKITALYCLEHRLRIAFATSVDALSEELQLAKPSLISAVPRIFEKVYAKTQHGAEAQHIGPVFERAALVAERWSREQQAGSVRLATRLEHAVYDRLLYRKIRASFGGELRMAFSGGGPLGERLGSFFDGIGLRIYEGYGLTETSPILTLSRSDAWSPGSVGTAVENTQLMLADDGEILAKGPQVFDGYWHNDGATAQVFDADGWFHTGDIGRFDEDGTLHIIGRSKDLIITAAGKNVAPAPLEDLLKAHSLISQAMVVGDQRPFIAALITIDDDAVRDWEQHNNAHDLEAEIQRAIDDANGSVSRAEAIRKFHILAHDFDLASGEITPTLKVRRAVINERYADLIDALYE